MKAQKENENIVKRFPGRLQTHINVEKNEK